MGSKLSGKRDRVATPPWFLAALIGALVLCGFAEVANAAPVALTRSQVLNDSRINHAVAFGDMDGDSFIDVVYAYQTRLATGYPNCPQWQAYGGACPPPTSPGTYPNVPVTPATPYANQPFPQSAQWVIEWKKNPGLSGSWTVGGSRTFDGVVPTVVGFTGQDTVQDIKVANINGSGSLDIVFSTNIRGTWWIPVTGGGATLGAPVKIYDITDNGGNYPNTRQIAVGDVDGDGDIDVVSAVGTPARIVLSTNNGTGTFTNSTPAGWTDPAIVDVSAIHLADLVDDPGTAADNNKLEIVVVSPGHATNKVVWGYHNGSTWGTPQRVGAAADHNDPRDAFAGDFDGDGRLDIVTSDIGHDRVRWFRNTNQTSGTTNFQSSPATQPGAVTNGDPFYVAAADFDADGDTDILATFAGATQFIYYDNNGDGTSFTARVYDSTTSGAPIQLNPYDFDLQVATRVAGNPPTDDWVDLVIVANGGDEVSFYNNLTYNNAPTYNSVVVESGDSPNTALIATFSQSMNNTANDFVRNPDSWTISGPGLNAATITTIEPVPATSDTQFRIRFSGNFLDGLDITATIDTVSTTSPPTPPNNYTRVQNTLGLHVVGSLAQTATNRLVNQLVSNTNIPGICRAYTTDTQLVLTAQQTGGTLSGPAVWSWRRNGVTLVSNGTTIVGAESPTLTITDVALITNGSSWTVELTDNRPEIVDSSATLQTAQPLSVSPGVSNQTRNVGQALDLDAAPGPWAQTATNGFVPRSFQWQYSPDNIAPYTDLSGAPFSNATTNDLIINPITLTQAGFYRLRVRDHFYDQTSGAGGFSNTKGNILSSVGTLTVTNHIFITTDPVGGNFYTNQSINLLVDWVGGDGDPGAKEGPTWLVTWKRGVTTLPSASGATLSLPLEDAQFSQVGNYNYSAVVDDFNAANNPATSGTAVVRTRDPMNMSGVIPVRTPTNGHVNTGGTITIVSGAPAVGMGHTPHTYQWYFDPVGGPVTFSPLSNGTGDGIGTVSDVDSLTLTITGATLTAAGNYRLQARDDNYPGPAQSFSNTQQSTITVTDLLAVQLTTGTLTGIDGLVSSSTGITTVYSGGNSSLSGSASGGDGAYTYQWQRSPDGIAAYTSLVGPQFTGANSPGLGISPMTTLNNTSGFYRLRVDDGSPDPAVTTVPIQLQVVANVAAPAPTAPENPGLGLNAPSTTPSRNNGESITFTVAATGGIPPLHYEWRFLGSPIIGAPDSPTYTINPVSFGDAGNYSVRVFDSGPGPQSQVSGPCTLTVTNFLSSIGPDDAFVYVGESPAEFELTVLNGIPPYTVNWYRLPNLVTPVGTETGTLGQTDFSLAVGPFVLADNNAKYRAVITDDSGGVNPAYSPADATLHVANPPQVTVDPQPVKTYDGRTVNFSVTAIGGLGSPLNYNWRKNSGTLGLPSQNTASFTALLADNGSLIDVVVTDSVASDVSGAAFDTSNAAFLTVGLPLVVPQPTPNTVSLYPDSAPVVFSTTPTDGIGSFTFAWFLDTGGAKAIIPLGPGDGAGNINVDPAAEPFASLGTGSFSIYVTVTDEVEPTTSAASTANVDPHLSVAPIPNQGAFVGQPVSVTVSASGGIGNLSYQWFSDTGSGFQPITDIRFTGVNSNTLTITPVAPGDFVPYRVEVADEGTDTGFAQFSLVPAQPLTLQPIPDQVVGQGDQLSVMAVASGGAGNLLYQWNKDSGSGYVPLLDDARINGSNTNMLTIDLMVEADAGNYQAVVLDSASNSASAQFVVSVGTGVPAAGLVGLALLSALSAIGGAGALRRRR